MATVQQLLDDIAEIKQNVATLKSQRDEAVAKFEAAAADVATADQRVADAQAAQAAAEAAVATVATQRDELQAGVDTAFAAAEDAKASSQP